MMPYIRDMKHAASAVVQDLDEEYVTSENMDQNMARLSSSIGCECRILLDRNDTVVASGLNTLRRAIIWTWTDSVF